MDTESAKLQIVLILTVGLGLSAILGYLTHSLRLSPLLGYLLAGYAIGPYSPGYVADAVTAEQLAEIGVVLMMFGVGLNFRIEELLAVRNTALPGALIQTAVTTFITTFVIVQVGWPLTAGIIFGLGIGVASTVVMVKMLQDNKLLKSEGGQIAVGWLVVEDLITVAVLLVLPNLVPLIKGEYKSLAESLLLIANTIAVVIVIKLVLFTVTVFTIGQKIASYLLEKVKQTDSRELFTLSILAMTFIIAIGSTYLLGTSIALGAFIAGMIVGRTEMRHQAVKHSASIKDAFVVLFFLSVGMLFNPEAIVHHPYLFTCILAIILLVKPLAAFLIMAVLKYPWRTAVTVAIALAQIGEFSFILSEEAMKYGLMPEDGYDVIVGCALISIALNPLLFRRNLIISKQPHG